MTNFNSVVLIGRVSRDPQLRYLPSGMPVCAYTVTVAHFFTTGNGRKEQRTTSIDVEASSRLAEICAQFLRQGREVLVMGTLRQCQSREADSSQLKVLAQAVQFLGNQRDSERFPLVAEDPNE